MTLKYTKDKLKKELLLSEDNQKVMMEWEQSYMQKSIDLLNPSGNVLEIGFGLGYSATQIQKYNPKSYTVIEINPSVIEKAKKWAEKYNNVTIIEGSWQKELYKLGKFDEIFFDDFPLNISQESTVQSILESRNRLNLFVDLCIQQHTYVGSKISAYLNNNKKIKLSSSSFPFTDIYQKSLKTTIPANCDYRDLNEQKVSLLLIKKVKEYDFEYANNLVHEKLKQLMK
tara:strand:- start:78 stop:761 length:684 start_codon:yes stop_codon:yes gene_type:complete